VPDGTSTTLLVAERYIDPAWVMVPGGPESNEF
jgi:hypothetical protein